MPEDNKYPLDPQETPEEKEEIDDTEQIDQGEQTDQIAQAAESEEAEEPAEEIASEEPPKKRKVSLTTYIVSMICVVLAAVMVTYNCCVNYLRRETADNIVQGNDSVTAAPSTTQFDVFKSFFERFSFLEIDEDKLVASALKAYVDSTGDVYAEYYTDEEWKALTAESEGQAEGIGINIINSTVTVNGMSMKAFKVINVAKDSPAQDKLKVGDMIAYVGMGENARTIEELGYTVALNEMKGPAGTLAEFTLYRPTDDGEYELIEFSIERAAVTTTTVYYHVSTLDSKVGIVKIIQFDMKTPSQFCEAMDSLLASGCDKFVFDLRYNPGGSLGSIETVLSYFLNEGDAIIHTSDKKGNYATSVAEPTEYITAEEIGKYRGVNAVVLCNESTASAAELFTATFRDYEMATIVGMKTYGKGSMQSLYSLGVYGIDGGLKLTTRMYYPPCGEGYDGIGITPDVVVELDEAVDNINIYELKDEQDNQLRTALDYFK